MTTSVWYATSHVSCGDTPITEYQTDGKPVPVTAPNGKWIRMRGTDRNGVVRTFVRVGDGWHDESEI